MISRLMGFERASSDDRDINVCCGNWAILQRCRVVHRQTLLRCITYDRLEGLGYMKHFFTIYG